MMIKELEIFFTHINRLMLHQDNGRNLGTKETIVMSQDCPKKWDGLAIAFVIQYIRCFRNFWGFANILLHIPLKMGEKKKIVSPAFSLKLKNMILVLTRGLICLFKWSYSQRRFDVAQRCENRCWKWQRCFDVV